LYTLSVTKRLQNTAVQITGARSGLHTTIIDVTVYQSDEGFGTQTSKLTVKKLQVPLLNKKHDKGNI